MRSKDFRFWEKAIYALVIFSLLILPLPNSQTKAEEDKCKSPWDDKAKSKAKEMTQEMWGLKGETTFGHSYFDWQAGKIIHYFTIDSKCTIERKVTYSKRGGLSFSMFHKQYYFDGHDFIKTASAQRQCVINWNDWDYFVGKYNGTYDEYVMDSLVDKNTNFRPLSLIINDTSPEINDYSKKRGNTVGLFTRDNFGKSVNIFKNKEKVAPIDVKVEKVYKFDPCYISGKYWKCNNCEITKSNYSWKDILIYAGLNLGAGHAFMPDESYKMNRIYKNISYNDYAGGANQHYGSTGANLWKYLDYFNFQTHGTLKGEFTLGEKKGCNLEVGKDHSYGEYLECFFSKGVGYDKEIELVDSDAEIYFILPKGTSTTRPKDFKFSLKYIPRVRDLLRTNEDYFTFVSNDPDYPDLGGILRSCEQEVRFAHLWPVFIDGSTERGSKNPQNGDDRNLDWIGGNITLSASSVKKLWERYYPNYASTGQCKDEDFTDENSPPGVETWVVGKDECQSKCQQASKGSTIGEYMCEATCIISEALGGVVEWIINSLLLPAAGIS